MTEAAHDISQLPMTHPKRVAAKIVDHFEKIIRAPLRRTHQLAGNAGSLSPEEDKELHEQLEPLKRDGLELPDGPPAGWSDDARRSLADMVERLAEREVKRAPGIARPLVTALVKQPVPLRREPAWQEPDFRTARWFKRAIGLAAKHCEGFDARQAVGQGHQWRRLPVPLLSSTCWLLEVRYPLAQAMRVAQFLVNENEADHPIEGLNGRSDVFHRWLGKARNGFTPAKVKNAEAVGSFARVFCRGIEGAAGSFVPLEHQAELTGRWLGEVPQTALRVAQPWVRLTPRDGADFEDGVVHLFHGAVLYDRDIYHASIIVRLPRPGRPKDAAGRVAMFDDQIAALGGIERGAPIVPETRDPLTHACFPLKVWA